MTYATTTELEAIESQIDALWSRHAEALAELKGGEARRGTAWHTDRLTELASIRESIRTREEMA